MVVRWYNLMFNSVGEASNSGHSPIYVTVILPDDGRNRRPKLVAEHRWMQCWSVVFNVAIQQMSIKKHNGVMTPI